MQGLHLLAEPALRQENRRDVLACLLVRRRRRGRATTLNVAAMISLPLEKGTSRGVAARAARAAGLLRLTILAVECAISRK